MNRFIRHRHHGTMTWRPGAGAVHSNDRVTHGSTGQESMPQECQGQIGRTFGLKTCHGQKAGIDSLVYTIYNKSYHGNSAGENVIRGKKGGVPTIEIYANGLLSTM